MTAQTRVRVEREDTGLPWTRGQGLGPDPPAWHLWIEADGELVSELWILDVKVRAWGTELLSAGVAGVETPERHRMKGYARELMESCAHFVADEGYEITTLFGIPNFYHRYGYATICPEFEIGVDASALVAEIGTATLGEATVRDMERVASMYNTAHASIDGSVVRDEGSWLGPRYGSNWDRRSRAFVRRDARGQAQAYAVIDDDLSRGSLVITDAAAADERASVVLLAGLAEMSRSRKASAVSFRVHPEAELGRLLRDIGATLETRRPENSGYMARVVDANAVVQKRISEVRAPGAARALDVPKTLNIETNGGSQLLGLGGAAMDALLKVDELGLAQLLFGYQGGGAVRRSGKADARGISDELLDMMFPQNDGYCFWPDRY